MDVVIEVLQSCFPNVAGGARIYLPRVHIPWACPPLAATSGGRDLVASAGCCRPTRA